MKPPRRFKVTTPLADKMNRPGGRTVAAALAAAGVALDSRRDEAMTATAATLAELRAVAARRDDGQADRIYAGAAALVDLAGFFDTGPLYEAAYSLCDVSDRMQASGVWRWSSVDVHLQALALILTEDCRRTDGSDALLAGLRALSEHEAAR